MATLKQRLRRKNASGTYDTIYFETGADLITGTLSVAHGGTGVTSLNALKTALNIVELPSGIILLWSGQTTNIPSGWVLCNGSNGTPDLRSRFVVGAGSTYTVGTTGGSNTVALVTGNLPSHNHSFSGSAASTGSHSHSATLNLSNLTTDSAGGHTHTVNRRVCTYGSFGNTGSNTAIASERILSGSAAGSANTTSSSSGAHTHKISGTGGSVSIASGGAHTHTVTGTVGNTGSGTAHENRPPYYALCYIMKL